MAKKQRQPERTKISVTTLPNGYGLEVAGNSYMYFTEQQLVEGILVHVGLAVHDYLSRETIGDLVAACATWPREGDAIKAAARQEAEIQALKETHQHDQETIRSMKEQAAKVAERMQRLQWQLEAYIKAEQEAKEQAEPKHAPRTRERAMAELKGEPRKKPGPKPKAKADNTEPAAKMSNRGRRSKADAAVLAEIERQQREKGNIL